MNEKNNITFESRIILVSYRLTVSEMPEHSILYNQKQNRTDVEASNQAPSGYLFLRHANSTWEFRRLRRKIRPVPHIQIARDLLH